MFKGIQDIVHKVTNQDQKPRDPSLRPVLTAEKLLVHEQRQKPIKNIMRYLSMPQADYQNLVIPLINDFAEFAQELPSTRHSYYSYHGGLLEHGLNRSESALSICNAYFLKDEAGEDTLSKPQRLWAYALFTAALLRDIGRLVVDLRVDICDRSGNLIKPWSAFGSSMVSQGPCYRYEFENILPDAYRRRSTILLARQLVPEEGFRWLASNEDVFSIWLAILDEDERSGGTLGPILWRADALALNQAFLELQRMQMAAGGPLSDAKRMFSTAEKAGLGGAEQEIGLAFIEWMREEAEAGRADESQLVDVEEGMLVTDKAFKDFVKENPQFKSWKGVQRAFTGMGLITVGAASASTQRFLNIENNTDVHGVVVKNRQIMGIKAGDLRMSSMTQHKFKYIQHPSATIKLPEVQFIAKSGALVSQSPKVSEPPPPKPGPTSTGM